MVAPVPPRSRSGPKQTASIPSLTKPPHAAQHTWSQGRRRASSDNATKLSPIGLIGSASADDFSGQGTLSNASTRSVGSLGSLGLGDDPGHGGNRGHGGNQGHGGSQGSVGRGGAGVGVEAEVLDGKSGAAATSRQLDSIVDEDRAEVIVIDSFYFYVQQ